MTCMNRYIITGATSFIGLVLCKELVTKGNKVTAICRNGSKGIAKLPKEVDIVHAQMSEYGSLDEKITTGADIFINLAWEGTAKAERESAEVQERNIQNTLNCVKVAKALGCSLFVESGSQAEYGYTEETISEESECHPITEYGKAKLRVRQEAAELCRTIGLKYIHLRIFSVYGETDHPTTLVMSGLDKMIAGERMEMSACTQKWNFLYSEDAAKQIRLLCEYALEKNDFTQEVFNIASNDTRVLKEFVLEMRDICQSKSELVFGDPGIKVQATLDPDISKTTSATGYTSFQSFDKIIRKIVRIKKGTDNPVRRGIDWFLSHIPNKFIRFCFVGCLNAGFGYGVYCLSVLLGASVWLATLISNILGVLWNFITTGNLVFENKDKKLIVRFILCYVANYFINTGAVYMFTHIGCNDYWAGLLATPIAAICSFFLLKFIVYRK